MLSIGKVAGTFFSAAAEAMRRVLVEGARRKRGPQRGGDLMRHDLEAMDLPSFERFLTAVSCSLPPGVGSMPIHCNENVFPIAAVTPLGYAGWHESRIVSVAVRTIGVPGRIRTGCWRAIGLFVGR